MCGRPVFVCKQYILSEIDEMDLGTALSVLKHYQIWRTGDDEDMPMPNPKDIGKALRAAIACMEREMSLYQPPW